MRHHYIPQFYLAGFTSTDSKVDSLWVLDKQNMKRWHQRIHKIGQETDYNKIEVQGVEDDAVEKMLSDFESKMAPIVKEVITNRSIPTGDDLVLLMGFIALMAMRVPSQRGILRRAWTHEADIIASMVVHSPEIFNTALEKAKEELEKANLVTDDTTYEKVKSFVKEKRYRVEVNKTSLIDTTLKVVDKVIPLLLKREWSLIFSDSKVGEFICIDDPVLREWTGDVHAPHGPGFASKHSVVIIPLSKHTAMMGTFNQTSRHVKASPAFVGFINRLLAAYAERFIYSTRPDFLLTNVDDKVTRYQHPE